MAAARVLSEKILQEAQRTRPQFHQGLDQNRGLNGHVQRASNAGALEGFSLPYFSRSAIRPRISVSAMSSSLRPKSAD